MSLILKGIDMPKEYTQVIAITPNGEVWQVNPIGRNEQLEAQAIQIPKEHGDIKDINTFLKDKSLCEYIENDVFNKKYSYWIGIGAIYNAPTILEAEGEER